MTDVIRRKHLALSTERSYCAWVRQYCDFVYDIPAHISSEQKFERFLTALAEKDIAARTQNQAFNAITLFYREVIGAPIKNIEALRVRRPEQVRRAPNREVTLHGTWLEFRHMGNRLVGPNSTPSAMANQ